MVTILPALRQVREGLVQLLDCSGIERLCRVLGYRWRSGLLDPFHTLHLFILQVLNRNTAMTHLPHLSGEVFTASAYCQARRRLSLKLFEQLVESFSREADSSNEDYRWRGRRLWLMDGSSFSMPDEPELQTAFGQPAGHAQGRRSAEGSSRADQLHRRDPLATTPQAISTAAGPGGQSATHRPYRAPLPQATQKAIPIHDPATRRTA